MKDTIMTSIMNQKDELQHV